MLQIEGEFPEMLINVFRVNHVYLQRRTEGNGATLALTFRISGEAPDLGLGRPTGIPAEIVVSHVSEFVIMRICVGPLLTWDPVNSGVGFSSIRVA